MTAGMFAPEMLPFAVSLGLMLFIAVLEIVGLALGASPSEAVDSMLPEVAPPPDALHHDGLDHDGAFSGVLHWLGVGRVPLLMLLVVFLCGFGLSGYVLQGATQEAVGFLLHPALASLGALAAALPITHAGSLLLARIMPREETEAVSATSFVGQVATITGGTARRGLPAEAKLRDRFGRTHYVRVEPDQDDSVLGPGSTVLILRQQGSVFRANATGTALVLPRPDSKEN